MSINRASKDTARACAREHHQARVTGPRRMTAKCCGYFSQATSKKELSSSMPSELGCSNVYGISPSSSDDGFVEAYGSRRRWECEVALSVVFGRRLRCEEARRATDGPMPVVLELGPHVPDCDVTPHDLGQYDRPRRPRCPRRSRA